MQAVSNQPVVVSMHAQELVSSGYTGGVWYQSECANNAVDHAIVIVGFDVGKCPANSTALPM